MNVGGGLLLGLLIGTVLYIIGGYFLPFLLYSIIMLLCIPFVAKFIPSKPMEEMEIMKQGEKNSDEDIEIGEIKNSSSGKKAELDSHETVTKPTTIKRRKINPFKYIWRLLSNKVRDVTF